MLIANRTGKVTEYKRGSLYLSHTQWEDGHEEIEVHRCVPEALYYSCDRNNIGIARGIFLREAEEEREGAPRLSIAKR